jgi:hypothetical protein
MKNCRTMMIFRIFSSNDSTLSGKMPEEKNWI